MNKPKTSLEEIKEQVKILDKSCKDEDYRHKLMKPKTIQLTIKKGVLENTYSMNSGKDMIKWLNYPKTKLLLEIRELMGELK